MVVSSSSHIYEKRVLEQISGFKCSKIRKTGTFIYILSDLEKLAGGSLQKRKAFVYKSTRKTLHICQRKFIFYGENMDYTFLA